MYAGALGDNAVERYAEFLVSLALSADFSERRLTLARASEHGLNVNVDRMAVVTSTAERTIEKAFGVQDLCGLPGCMLTNIAFADITSIRRSIVVDYRSSGSRK